MYLCADCVAMFQARDEVIEKGPLDSDWTPPGIGGQDSRDGTTNKPLGEILVNGMAPHASSVSRFLRCACGAI